ncbi:MAG: bifunctional 5,10-methylene-tetrahydrofolate dehydrogenase/5,10-methylene-tetrahydrofolate cyclohydrolase [Odoribacter splanchnicus]|nr:tetrahydrofolate dehydrogenase/cyclohydrolase catalytic domain-containing protein [Odoribacter splanchnicus]MBS6595208.1 bifunctional 5,10-methylene-tetrahydrofolate dehydrogenase/5,10-methylene-tetrahydrofolate cyclohydrolase [Odoribacter splanchnicus]
MEEMELIDGKKIATQVKQELADEVKRMKAAGAKTPHLVAVLVGNDPASETYVASKVKACQEVGFKSTEMRYSADITEEQLLAVVDKLNQDADVDGYIVQLPLPRHISEHKVLMAIDPDKDVDGFHPCNVGKMVTGLPAYLPATPAGIVELLKRYEIPTQGKHCVVIGRSNIVGTPMAVLMSRKDKYADCTVTICHSRTQNIKEMTLQAEVPSDKTKSGFRLVGDVDFEGVAPKCSYITPVPGGVGPMTIVSLLQNTLKACKGLADK